ncbi:Argonaute-like protein [Mycena venus]|uniref:Argonaute-like protein n=1 Tax=Mycena venus TaxID=2733690 RepID=A0A8H6XCP2_9AGAR|nr:Argonaute-like protein [Mycena venus]
MYRPGPLIEVCMAVLDVRDIRKLSLRDSRHDDYKKLERHLKNKLIQVKTRDGPPRTKTVRGLVPGPVGGYEFHPSGSGPMTTVGGHYHKTYQITLQYPDTIGVVTSGKGAPFKVVIPLELCNLVSGQLYKKKLPPDATATVVGFAAMPPRDRINIITTGGGGQQRSPVQDYQNSEFLVDAGMRIEQTAINVRGRMLSVPPLMYNQSTVTPRNGAWNVLGAKFFAPKEMKAWGIINFDPQRIREDRVEKVRTGIMDCCTNLGMNIAPPRTVRAANGHNVRRGIEDICREIGGNVDMLVVLLPAKADEIRIQVKYLCDVELDVALKINARLGGSNALVNSSALRELSKMPFIIMGVCGTLRTQGRVRTAPPSPASSGLTTCTAPPTAPRHACSCRAPEIITDLKAMVAMAVTMFGKKHSKSPAHVVFFRDGVSEGEFSIVKKEEITQINGKQPADILDGNANAGAEAFDAVWANFKLSGPKPKLTFIVVGKRHHVSFFPRTPQEGDKTGNCHAGLVVDEELRNPQFPDYYLQSHAAIKGTSRSAHYTVLQDEIFDGNTQKLQELSFALCHIYAKSDALGIYPRPYADLACARGKFHFDPQSDMDLDGSTTIGGQTEFKLDPWEHAFKHINNNVKDSMYFL